MKVLAQKVKQVTTRRRDGLLWVPEREQRSREREALSCPGRGSGCAGASRSDRGQSLETRLPRPLPTYYPRVVGGPSDNLTGRHGMWGARVTFHVGTGHCLRVSDSAVLAGETHPRRGEDPGVPCTPVLPGSPRVQRNAGDPTAADDGSPIEKEVRDLVGPPWRGAVTELLAGVAGGRVPCPGSRKQPVWQLPGPIPGRLHLLPNIPARTHECTKVRHQGGHAPPCCGHGASSVCVAVPCGP